MKHRIVDTLIPKYELLKHAIHARDIAYIYGPPSSGKTFLAKETLASYPEILKIFIDCNRVTTSTSLYINIIKSLETELNLRNSKKKTISKTLSLLDFIKLYHDYVYTLEKRGYETTYIVLDRVELLSATNTLETTLSLSDIHSMNLILISNETPDCTLDKIGVVGRCSFFDRLNIIQLKVWTKTDIVEIIIDEPPKKFRYLYERFVNNVVSVLHQSQINDPSELKLYCQENFPIFCDFYLNKLKELIKQKGIDHQIKDEDLESPDFFLDNKSEALSIIGSFAKSMNDASTREKVSWIPEDSKVVLGTSLIIISAYVASYTTPANDKKNFVKFQKRRANRNTKQGDNCFDLDKGSKSFSLERLLHIYEGLAKAIDVGKENNSSVRLDLPDSVLSDVQQLQELNMIKITLGDGLSSSTKYKLSSLVDGDYVKRVAEQINFSLNHLHGLY